MVTGWSLTSRIDWYSANKLKISDTVGIDEVGRGPLAGPVITAAAWLDEIGVQMIAKSGFVIRDSKKMTQTNRRKVVDWLKTISIEHMKVSIAGASVEEIDSLNILNATMLAMRRAYDGLGICTSTVLVDGNKSPNIPNVEVKPIIKGDDQVLSISLASIVAKQYRDNLMRDFALQYPEYDFASNVGYGTKKHLEAIYSFGITPIHRKSFAPMKDMLSPKYYCK